MGVYPSENFTDDEAAEERGSLVVRDAISEFEQPANGARVVRIDLEGLTPEQRHYLASWDLGT